MLVNILATLLGILMFLFVFWKRMREDFSSQIIFQTASAILIGIGLGSLVSSIFLPSWSFWISLVVAVIVMLLMRAKFKLRFHETLEALILASMPWLSLTFLIDSIRVSSMTSFLAFIVILVMVFFSYWLDMNYKGFTWYKSGKVGFAGLSIAILFFLTRTVLAVVGITMLSFAGKFEVVFSGIVTLICLVLLINLGKNKK